MPVQKIEEIGYHKLQEVRLTIENHVAVMTLQPLTEETAAARVWYEIWLVQDYINQNQNIWMCFLRSDLKTFCSCVDIRQLQQDSPYGKTSVKQQINVAASQSLFNLRVPLICAVHGHCLGGGLCYPAGADISISVKGTLFGAPEAKLSVVGGSGHLARILPPQIQRDMCYCGSTITAEELHEKYGGVTLVVDSLEQLMPAAMDKARELCKRGPLVLRYLKACVNEQEDFQMHRKN